MAVGFQMFILGVINAWIPSYMSRYYGLAPDKAAMQAAVVVLVAGVGMIICGGIVDRLGVRDARNRLRVPAAYAAITCVLLVAAFALPPGLAQYALILCGVFVSGGHLGASGAAIADVTHPGLRATAIATIVLANNILGLAPGPLLVGALSDVHGLKFAMGVAPLVCLLSATFWRRAPRRQKSPLSGPTYQCRSARTTSAPRPVPTPGSTTPTTTWFPTSPVARAARRCAAA